VAETYDQLNQVATANPSSVLYNESGGHIMRDADTGNIIAVASDDLIDELDAAVEAANSIIEARELNEGAEGELNVPMSKRYYGDDYGSMINRCSHPRCFNHLTCQTYSYCHVCSSSTRKLCI